MQGPSPYTTLRTDELRNQKTMANLMNVLPPERETLVNVFHYLPLFSLCF